MRMDAERLVKISRISEKMKERLNPWLKEAEPPIAGTKRNVWTRNHLRG